MPSISGTIFVDQGSDEEIVINWSNEPGRSRIGRSSSRRARSGTRYGYFIPPPGHERERDRSQARERSRPREQSRRRLPRSRSRTRIVGHIRRRSRPREGEGEGYRRDPDANPFAPLPDYRAPPMIDYPNYDMYQPPPPPPIWPPPSPGILLPRPRPRPYLDLPPPPRPRYDPMAAPPPAPWPRRGRSPGPVHPRNPFEPLPHRRSPIPRRRSPVAEDLNLRPRRSSLHVSRTRTRTRTPRPIPITHINLDEHPRHITFPTEEALLQHTTDIYRPLVEIVSHIVQDRLRLRRGPAAVEFDMYAVRINSTTGGVMLDPHAPSRAPLFRVTLPDQGLSQSDLQAAADALRTSMEARPGNAWYRHAGYLFQVSSRRRGEHVRHHYWLPPACVWKRVVVGNETHYRVRIRSPAPSQVQELARTLVYDDDDDESEEGGLEDGMRRLVYIGLPVSYVIDGNVLVVMDFTWLTDFYSGSIYLPSRLLGRDL
ncbi:hypothetical protein GGR53DRAFT_482574 [Hypoxylon sp. FL1150]|nr:hypothetical protein GGR53DRAFT_482574 [Hypoxylon sp. FL1150]